MYQRLHSFRTKINYWFNSFRVDPEVYPLVILMAGGIIWSGYFYSRKFAWDLDSSQPFGSDKDFTNESQPLMDVLKKNHRYIPKHG